MRTRQTNALGAAAVAAGLLAAAACGGSGDQAAALPDCANAGSPVALPATFPDALPLPDGTVMTSTREEAGFDVAEGFIPGALEEGQDFFLRELPEAGFELGEGDAEEHEAETEFSGQGVDGRLKMRSISDCPDALTLAVAVRRR